jgi:drug/metabolite transporter (DMT)-like permease
MEARTAGDLWALAASLCLAGGPLFAVTPVRLIGPAALSALRALIGSLVLAIIAAFLVHRPGGTTAAWAMLAASGLIGIYLADILVFRTVHALGARVAAVLYAIHVPLTALLAVPALDEVPTLVEMLGIALCFAGLCLAILARDGASALVDEPVRQGLPAGLLAGLGAAFCQSAALIFVRSALNAGADPIAAATIRVALPALLINFFRRRRRQDICALPRPWPLIIFGTLASALLVNAGAAIFTMVAISHANRLASVTALSALAPVMLVPMVFALTGRPPGWRIGLGAALAIVGVGLIVAG